MQTSAQKSKKTSGGLNDLHVDDRQENVRKFGIDTFYLLSRNL